MPRLLTILATLALAAPASAQTMLASGVVTYRFGVERDPVGSTRLDLHHMDLTWSYRAGGAFQQTIRSDVFPGLLDPALYHLYANPATRRTQPSNPLFSFTGVAPGQPVWIMPQTLTAGQIYMGLSSEAMTGSDIDQLAVWNPLDPRDSANTPGRRLQVMLVGVRGPGVVSAWQTTGVGTITQFITTLDGLDPEADRFHLGVSGHTHFNWAFSQTGLYELDFQVRTLSTLNFTPGDINNDGRVDLLDLDLLAQNLGRRDDRSRGDLTGDGLIDLFDAFEVQQNFGFGTGGLLGPADFPAAWAALTVPEPSLLVLAPLACLSLNRQHRTA